MDSMLTLPNVTCIDHAYIDASGAVKGRSFFASFVVRGAVEASESVVVDFSKVKKNLKAFIDDHDEGFDHKLWVLPGQRTKYGVVGNDCWVDTKRLLARVPLDATRVIPLGETLFLASQLELYLEKRFSAIGLNLDIQCILHQMPQFIHSTGVYAMFNYVHGLKKSSSYGCQNILHGHTSYLQLLPSLDYEAAGLPAHAGTTSGRVAELCLEICKDLNDTVFVYADNCAYGSNIPGMIRYTSANRGYMEVSFRDPKAEKICVLETETTIEHLIEYVAARYADELKELGIAAFVMSEGLAKGALKHVEY